MKAVMVMFDSLNRHMLPPYNAETWVHAPNFQRLAQRAVTFDRSYVCSMPCMPARRDLHTGRPNFLHRSWGPLEPFDDSMPQLLKQHGIHTALISDHQHYWEDGGGTYHNRYTTWQFHRGQEGDAWMGQVAHEPVAEGAHGRNAAGPKAGGVVNLECQDRVNRKFMPTTADLPQTRTFAAGLDFIHRNHADDNWFLQLETFDPHEPFFTHREFKDLYAEHFDTWSRTDGRLWDWPAYRPVEATETPKGIEHMRHQYAALVSMCDARLGDVLDAFDRHQLWDDTMLIVWTDHGFLLGEHESWAKCWCPFYEEISHTPFFMWDPRHPDAAGERRAALVQPAIDLPVSLLNYFGLAPTLDMLGQDLAPVIANDQPVRDAAIFGMFGGHVNVTDGRYVYMRGPATDDNQPLIEYTLMPTHMNKPFAVEEFHRGTELAEPFPFTKGCPTLRLPTLRKMPGGEGALEQLTTRLYDLETDPLQKQPVENADVEQQMTSYLVDLMAACHAPPSQYERLGLPSPVIPTATRS